MVEIAKKKRAGKSYSFSGLFSVYEETGEVPLNLMSEAIIPFVFIGFTMNNNMSII